MHADRQMADYIRKRNESADYTQHLGLIARVRSDFEQLSILLRDVKEESQSKLWERFDEKDKDRKRFPRIQRIILYIDDLDRCPEKTVFEVLQAVHLLLAFPLFVVVVGVDPRWLLHSLELHSGALQATDGVNGDATEQDLYWQPTPLNYLEKIFQIPYTLLPINKTGFANMVDALASDGQAQPVPDPEPELPRTRRKAKEPSPAPTLHTDVAPAPEDATAPPGPQEEPTVSLAPKTKPATQPSKTIDRNPSHLRIEKQERDFMKRLYNFIPSPRAGKRFVNIYRLLRASVEDKERASFVGNTYRGDYQAALLLLAILTGFPNEATELFRVLVEEKPQSSWWTFIESFKARMVPELPAGKVVARADSDNIAARSGRSVSSTPSPITGDSLRRNWTALYANLDGVKRNLEDRSCDVFTVWAARVARYSFQTGRVVLYQNLN
jgi:hypothetical protein